MFFFLISLMVIEDPVSKKNQLKIFPLSSEERAQLFRLYFPSERKIAKYYS